MSNEIPLTNIDFNKHLNFSQLKAAVQSGNASFVAFYLAQPDCPLSDVLEDIGYPDADGYNPTVVHSLLYEAVPHPAVLKLLLKDGRFNPNANNKDAFYRCLLSGSIEGIKLFYEDKRFSFPEDALVKAAELGGKEVIEFLLELDESEDHNLFLPETKDDALDIALDKNDNEISEIIMKYLDNSPRSALSP
ncbi:hypothetical protein ACNVED_09165 [Legionella sp. D16C41]|uniref:hypothetical protein n=1 Tax=Legionella sp. D16C41 TaxID=3402688 RepID=UPI003AF90734